MSKKQDKKTDERGIIRRTYYGDEESGAVRMTTIDKEKHRAEFVITTEMPVQDSYYGPSTSLSMKGAILKDYRRNPVILAQHEHGPIEVIGKTIKIKAEDDQLIALAEFDVDDEFSARIWGKIERGFLRAASIGFRTITTRLVEEGKVDKNTGLEGPVIIATKWRLYEWSIVAVGADSESLGRSSAEDNEHAADDDTEIKFYLPSLENNFKLP